MQIITREELKAKMDRGDDFTLFEVLPLMYWRKHHLPGAKSLPPTQVATVVPELVPDHTAEIVLYCWDDDCPTSGWAGGELEAMGYTNISEYSAGKKDWIDAGRPMVKDWRGRVLEPFVVSLLCRSTRMGVKLKRIEDQVVVITGA